MPLSAELISQFVVEITKNKTDVKNETIVYGTITKHDGNLYVKIDGSDLLTPVNTTAAIKDGERVTVMIKNHTATVTGNISSPSASSGDLDDTNKKVGELDGQISEFGEIVAKSVSTEQLNAANARIDTLVSDNVLIKNQLTADSAKIVELEAKDAEITGKLTASEADISELKTEKLDAEFANLNYAKVEDLNATNAKINNLGATYATIEKLNAANAEIDKLEADKLSADEAKLKYAEIAQLNAVDAKVGNLSADVADIDTLIFGSAAGDTISANFANAVIAQLGNAQIKSAMIDSVTADKVTSGTIVTNNVQVTSEDGKLFISDETIQISDENRVRVQIGKDAEGDYSINIWDTDGNLMFSEGGITDNAIKQAIIRNDMVSETANISASKLDISSLFSEINGSTETIESSRVYLDDKKQALDVAFTSLSSDVSGLSNDVSSQGTQIQAIQGQIASKVWQQDIDDSADGLTTTFNNKYSSLEQTVNGLSSTVSSNKTELQNAINDITIGGRNLLQNSASSFYVHGAAEGIVGSITDEGYLNIVASSGNANWISVKLGTNYDNVENNLSEGDEFVISFTMRSPDTTDPPTIYIKPGLGYYKLRGALSSEWSQVWYAGVWKESGNIQPHFGLGDLVGTYEVKNCKIEKGNRPTDWSPAPEDMEARVSSAESRIEQTEKDITARVTSSELNTKLGGYYTKDETEAKISASVESGIELSVKNVYATKEQVSDIDDEVTNLENEVANIEIGGRNLVSVGKIDEARNVDTTADFELRDCWASTFITNANLVEILEPAMQYTVSYDIELIERTTVPTVFDMMCGFLIYSQAYGTWISLATNMSDSAEIGTVQHIERTFTTPNAWNDEKIICYSRRWTTNGLEPVGFDAFRITDFKIEKGNKATDWTPAPEDVEDDIKEVNNNLSTRVIETETSLKLLKDSVLTLVEDEDGSSLLTQTSTGWTFSTQAIQKAVETTSTELNNLSKSFDTTDALVDELGKAVNDINTRTRYVNVGEYDNNGTTEACIELGDSETDYKLLIGQTQILFKVGSDVPTRIDIDGLVTDNITVENELRQINNNVSGRYVSAVRNNGNWGFQWKGDDA